MVLQGRVTQLDQVGFWRVHKKMIAAIMATMTLGAIALAALAPLIIPIIATEAFAPSAEVLQVLCIGVVAATLNTLMGLQWILRGLFLQSAVLTLVTGLINCLLNLFLIPRFGAVGAAWATVAGVYFIPFTANLLMAIRVEREQSGEHRAA
jgi:O-antigen/teichoic acid export membrane protein